MSNRIPFPNKIDIGYITFNIKDRREFPGVGEGDGESLSGQTCMAKKEISVYHHLSENETDECNTLLHECLHGAFYAYGLHNVFNDKKEEFMVNAFGNMCIELFQRNPELLSYIQKVNKKNS